MTVYKHGGYFKLTLDVIEQTLRGIAGSASRLTGYSLNHGNDAT